MPYSSIRFQFLTDEKLVHIHVAQHMLCLMGIDAIMLPADSLLITLDAPFIMIFYDDLVCCYHVNHANKCLLFCSLYDGGKPCKSLGRFLARKYPSYSINTHDGITYSPKSQGITTSLAHCLLFCLQVAKKCEMPITNDFLSNFQECILLTYRQMDKKVPMPPMPQISITNATKCKHIVQQYIHALTLDEKARRNTIYKHLKNDVQLLNAKKHMKMSWNMCVSNLKKELVALEYMERHDVCMHHAYTHMLEACRVNLVNHFQYLVSLYSGLGEHGEHGELEFYQLQVSHVSDTMNLAIDVLLST